ncbi:MAG: accessory factor UbiK family protein [Dichotomicrobium sp.]
MTQTTNKLFDDFAKLMTDAAGAAQSARQDFETMARAQMERVIRDLDLVQREEFEAVREMAQKAREENEALKARIERLESALNIQPPVGDDRAGPDAGPQS